MKKKIIEKENYYEFIKREFKSLLLKPENYLYFSLALIATGIYWHETNFHETLEVLMLFCTSCAIVFFIIELFFVLVNRKLEINNLITRFCLALIFSILSVIYYEYSYFHTLLIFILFFIVPITIVYVINKIRVWLNL